MKRIATACRPLALAGANLCSPDRRMELRDPFREASMYCRDCRYDLRATANRCPECGRAFDPEDPRTYIRIDDDPKDDRWFAVIFSVVSLTMVGTLFLSALWLIYMFVRIGFWER